MTTSDEKIMTCSVIIPSYNSARSIRHCLDAISLQETKLNYEIIVADSSDDETASIIQKHYPHVQLIRFQQKTDPGTARNAGIEKAKGSILLFTDSDCIVAKDWLDNMVVAHRNSDSFQVVGGAVVPANPETLASLAGYFIEFSEYMPSMPAGAVNSIPTCNISYRREIFEKYGKYQGEYYPQEDYLFHWNLNRQGEKVLFCPHIQVRHFQRSGFSGYIKHNFRFGQITARVLKLTDLPGSFFVKRPWLAPLFIPFLPFIKFIRTCLRLTRCSTDAWRRPLVFPVMLAGLIIWGAGFIRGTYSKNPT